MKSPRQRKRLVCQHVNELDVPRHQRKSRMIVLSKYVTKQIKFSSRQRVRRSIRTKDAYWESAFLRLIIIQIFPLQETLHLKPKERKERVEGLKNNVYVFQVSLGICREVNGEENTDSFKWKLEKHDFCFKNFPQPVSPTFIYTLYLHKRQQSTCIYQTNSRYIAQVHRCYERWVSSVCLIRDGIFA